MSELVVKHGTTALRRYALSSDELVLGRGPECDVVLASTFVSHRHARLTRSGGAYDIVDEGSRNGVFVNGRRLGEGEKRRLGKGDEVVIADFVLTYWESSGETAAQTRDLTFEDAIKELSTAKGAFAVESGPGEALDLRRTAVYPPEVADGSLSLPGGTVTVLFVDIVDSTALTERLGDAAYRAKTRDLDGTLREQIRECGGVPVAGKVLGDGVMAVFTAARDAIDCALHCREASEAVGISLHLGLHAGDVLSEGDNVYGGTVNLAARISAASEPGEVLVSSTVRALARTSAGVKFEDRGEHALKGIDEPQRLFRVQSA